MNKDFYNNLPSFVCEILDKLIDKHSNQEWFKNAWEEYRQHILTSDIDNMKMPDFVF